MKTLVLFVTALSAVSCTAVKIQDCPEQLIINRMPGPNAEPKSYYIYKGERKEVKDFDAEWLKQNCQNIKTDTVY